MEPETESTSFRDNSSVASLLRELRDEATELLRKEVALAKLELSEKVAQIMKNSALIGVAGVIAFCGLLILLIGLASLLSYAFIALGLDPAIAAWLGPVALGLVVLLIGGGLLLKARSALSGDALAPDRTLTSIRENREWAEHKIHQSRHEQPAV